MDSGIILRVPGEDARRLTVEEAIEDLDRGRIDGGHARDQRYRVADSERGTDLWEAFGDLGRWHHAFHSSDATPRPGGRIETEWLAARAMLREVIAARAEVTA